MDTREARKLSCKIVTNLTVIEKITDEQRAALVELMQDSRWTMASVSWSFDLPSDWLYVIMSTDGANFYHLGISPEGGVHS